MCNKLMPNVLECERLLPKNHDGSSAAIIGSLTLICGRAGYNEARELLRKRPLRVLFATPAVASALCNALDEDRSRDEGDEQDKNPAMRRMRTGAAPAPAPAPVTGPVPGAMHCYCTFDCAHSAAGHAENRGAHSRQRKTCRV